MKETFDANLSQTQKEGTENQKAYEDLKAVKEDEIAAGQEQIETKTQELAITDEKLANSKEDLEDTRNTPSADEKFLMDLKEKCQMTDQEWEERQRTRQEEMAAVSKALAIPSSAALQTEEPVGISTLPWHQMHKHSDILGEVVIPRRKRIIASFVQAQEDHFKATAPHADRQAGPERRELRADLR